MALSKPLLRLRLPTPWPQSCPCGSPASPFDWVRSLVHSYPSTLLHAQPSHIDVMTSLLFHCAVSWLPNVVHPETGDVHTEYVTNIAISATGSRNCPSWRVQRSYGDFIGLQRDVGRSAPGAQWRALRNKFPDDRLTSFMFELDDKRRKDRMDKINLWLADVCSDPVVMTTVDVFRSICTFADAHQHFKTIKDVDLTK